MESLCENLSSWRLLTTWSCAPLTVSDRKGTVEFGRPEGGLMENVETSSVGAEKRRNTRVLHSAAITVKGLDALGRPFRESTKTLMVSCYGCRYESAYYPAPNSGVMVEIRYGKSVRSPRMIPARVIWVQRPKSYRALYSVAVEFEVPGNVWDIALPPEDWFPCPGDEDLLVPESVETRILERERFVVTPEPAPAENPEGGSQQYPEPPATPGQSVVQAMETLVLSDESEIRARRHAAERREEEALAMRELVKITVAQAVAEEVALMRQRIDSQLQEAIDRAVKTLVDRITQSAALQHVDLENKPIPDASHETPELATDQPHEFATSGTADAAIPNQNGSRKRRAARRARKAAGIIPQS
jgi:hypothetical protein